MSRALCMLCAFRWEGLHWKLKMHLLPSCHCRDTQRIKAAMDFPLISSYCWHFNAQWQQKMRQLKVFTVQDGHIKWINDEGKHLKTQMYCLRHTESTDTQSTVCVLIIIGGDVKIEVDYFCWIYCQFCVKKKSSASKDQIWTLQIEFMRASRKSVTGKRNMH